MFVGAGAYTSNDNLLMQESIMLNIEPGANNGGNPAEQQAAAYSVNQTP